MGEQEQQNIAIVRRFIDGAVNGGDASVIDQTWDDDLVWNGGSLGRFRGRDAFKRSFAESASSAWQEMHLEIHEIIAAGEKVVLRFTNSGTNVGPFLGHPPTGGRAEWLGIGIYTVRSGRIAEGWFAEDIFGLLQQLEHATPSA
jgi:predicted ester cyclase